MGWHARKKLEHLTPDQRQHLPDTHNLPKAYPQRWSECHSEH